MRTCGAHRRLLAFAAVSAAVALASGCGGGSDAPASAASPPATFRNSELSFRHPAAWKAYPFTWAGELHFRPLLYVSTQPVHDPCRTKGDTVTCTWPVARLRPGGVLLTLENRGFPGWSLDDAPGTPLRVGGRQAKRSIERPGQCGSIGAEETIAVAVASPLADNWTELTACLRGPRLAANEHGVDALLASLRFR
jgi:hypothetical protein